MSEPTQPNNYSGAPAGNTPAAPGGDNYAAAPGGNLSAGQANPYAYTGNPYAGMQQAPAAAPARPRLVDLAFWLIIASSALNIINYLVTMNYVNSAVGTTAVTVGGVALVGLFIGTGVRIALAVLARQGWNWARIVLAVFAAFSLTGLLSITLFGALGAITGLLSIGSFVAAVIMLFLKPSNEFFSQSGAFRKAAKFAQ